MTKNNQLNNHKSINKIVQIKNNNKVKELNIMIKMDIIIITTNKVKQIKPTKEVIKSLNISIISVDLSILNREGKKYSKLKIRHLCINNQNPNIIVKVRIIVLQEISSKAIHNFLMS